MHYVYILKSKLDKGLYIGQTSDLRKRLEEHNAGKNTSTKSRVPFELIYYEAYSNSNLAKLREVKLKKFGQSYYQLKKRIGLL
jgi:putative endonuclease